MVVVMMMVVVVVVVGVVVVVVVVVVVQWRGGCDGGEVPMNLEEVVEVVVAAAVARSPFEA